MSVSIVAQRFRQCKILLDETEWVTVGGSGGSVVGSNHPSAGPSGDGIPIGGDGGCGGGSSSSNSSSKNTGHCGLLVYISFASTTTHSHVEQASQTLINLPILTSGLWGDGSSSTLSISSYLSQSSPSALSSTNNNSLTSCSVVIVPQANLISKVKQNGKSIQYHGQIDKAKGRDLYEYFCDCVRSKVLEMQCQFRKEELPNWYLRRKAHFERLENQQQLGSKNGNEVKQNNDTGNNNKQAPPSILPKELFRYHEKTKSKYSAYDENGFPLKDAEGKDLSKAAIKKLRKIHEGHCKRHEKWKLQQQQQQQVQHGIAMAAKRGDEAGEQQTRSESPIKHEKNSKTTEISHNSNNPSSTHENKAAVEMKAKEPNLQCKPELKVEVPPTQWEDSLDKEFCHVVAGTFGKRQGLEFYSDMGPFVHSFQI